MAVVTTELEVTSSLTASKLFKIFNDFDNIALKIEPQIYKSVSVIKGDGGAGSIKSIEFADGMPYTSVKETIDAIDTSNLSMTYTIFEGDALMGIIDTATHQLKFIPSANGGSIYKHSVVFKCKGDAKLTEDLVNLAKERFKNTFKALESYGISHPEAY